MKDPTSAAINQMVSQKTRASALGHVALVLVAMLALPRAEAIRAWPLMALLFVCVVCRVALAEFYNVKGLFGESTWRKLTGLAAVGAAACWSALLVCVLLARSHIDHVAVAVLIMVAGLAVAGTTSLSPDRTIGRLFVSTLLVPACVTLLAYYPAEGFPLACILAVSLLFLFSQIESQAKTIRAFQDREEKYQALTAATREVVLIHQDGVILEANAATEVVLGYSPKEVIGTSILHHTPKEDWEKNIEILKDRHDETLIVRCLRKDGSIFHAEIYGRFFEYKGVRAKITCLRNIQERINAEEAIHESTRQIEIVAIEREQAAIETARLKSEFLANMSHEIRTPLNAIIGITDLLGDLATTPQMKRYLRMLSDSSESLLVLVNDILDFSKIDADKMDLEKIQFNIGNVIESQSDLLATRAQQKNLMIVAGIDPELPALVQGDSGRVGQVLLNLIGNAIKFTEKGHISVRAMLQGADKGFATIRFEVQDTGSGLSKAVQEKLFRPFSQADSSTSRKHGGTGLGLSICKKIVEKMGGEIGVESTPGVGSIFWFTLPLEVIDSGTMASQYARGDWSSRQVFVVSDENSSARSIAANLQSWGLSATIGNMSWIERSSRNGNQLYDVVIVTSSLRRKGKFAYSGSIIELSNEGALAPEIPGAVAAVSVPVRQSDLYSAICIALKSEPESDHSSSNTTGAANLAAAAAKPLAALNARVLVAEDNSTNQMLVLAQLRKLGITAQAVTNGAEAIEALIRTKFDLVLMDCQMPEVDGFEATIRIRELEKTTGQHIPIIALTANAFEEDKRRCLEVGMDAYLSKPLRREQLVLLLQQYLVQDAA